MKSPMFISLKPVQMKIEFGEFLELLRTLVIDILVRMPAMHRTRFINSGVSNPVLTMGALALALAAMQFFKESVKTSNSLEQLCRTDGFGISIPATMRDFYAESIYILSDLLLLVDLFLGSDDETGEEERRQYKRKMMKPRR